MAKTVCSQADIRNPLSLLAHNQIEAGDFLDLVKKRQSFCHFLI